MTVKELKKKLENYPDDLEVFIRKYSDASNFSLVEEITEKEVLLINKKSTSVEAATEVVLVISDF